MGGVADQCDAPFWTYPRGERVTEDELPVYKAVFGRCADDGVANRCPVWDGFYRFVDVAWGRPAFFYVGLVLGRVSSSTNMEVGVVTLWVKTQLQAVPFCIVATRKCTSGPNHPT